MDNGNVPEHQTGMNTAADTSPPFDSSLFKSLWSFVKDDEEMLGKPRHVADAGLLTICIVFLAAMLGLTQKEIDIFLTIALVAFAFAFPTLACGFVLSFYKDISAPDDPETTVRVLIFGLTVAYIAQTFGEIVTTVGVIAVITHLCSLAFPAFATQYIVVIVVFFFVLLFSLFGWTSLAYWKLAYVAPRIKGTAVNTRGNDES